MKILLWIVLSLTAVAACSAHIRSLQPDRIIALGDLHGDLEAARRALRLASIIDAQDHWIGEKTHVVQTGDLLDRGDQELELFQFFEKLSSEAEAAGGQVHILNGNHEIMNAQGDFRYVTRRGFELFAQLPPTSTNKSRIQQFPPLAQGRAAAFLPRGPYALKLAQRPVILQLGSILFVHGGLHPHHAHYGLEQINRTYQDWLAGKQPHLPDFLQNESSPIWTRAYSNLQQPPDCALLHQTLEQFNARYLVVGHTVQPRINGACNGHLWRIDVGLSRGYGGPIQVLEIRGEQWQILEEAQPSNLGMTQD